MPNDNPEMGESIQSGDFSTNYHDMGSGEPILFIHGSGPGVTAWANWRLVLPALSSRYRVLAPDMVGFGYTDRPESISYNMDTWIQHLLDFMDALNLLRVHLVGNSFGGALALAMAIRHPQRVNRLVLMGAAGVEFDLTEGLDAVWGYTPSLENMQKMMDLFTYDRSLVNNELAELRYRASIQPGFQKAFAAMFPSPRQRWITALASSEEDIRKIEQETLIIHGREDQVIPLDTSLKLFSWVDNAQLHLFGKCGHWTQIEQNQRFCGLLNSFFSE